MEPVVSLPCSLEPATNSYPQPDESIPQSHPISLRYLSILFSYLRLGTSFGFSYQHPVWTPLLSHTCYMVYQFRSPWLHLFYYILREVQVTKFLTVQLPPAPLNFSFLRINIPLSTLFSVYTQNYRVSGTLSIIRYSRK
jgi:hypothetical protein